MLMEIIVEGAIACLGWGGLSHFWDEKDDRSFGNGKGYWKILKLPDRKSRFVPADSIHNWRDGGNRTGGIEPEEERERQRDREQIELYKQKEQEQKDCDREQIEIDRKNEDKEKKRSRQLENIIFFVGTAIGGGQIFWASYPLIKDTPIK